MDKYLWESGNILAGMRLLIGGAVELYEQDAQPLSRLAIDNGNARAASAFDTIGKALSELKEQICALQEMHSEEIIRQVKGAPSAGASEEEQ